MPAETESSQRATLGGPTDPTHDPRLRRGVLDTAISRTVAQALIAAFLLLIYGVPASQAVLEWLEDDESSLTALVQRPPTQENLREFERQLELASYAKELVQPQVQLALSRYGRAGNKRALIGHAGWLFYTPGLTHVAGPSFLEPDPLRPQTDPRPAIFAFARMLARRGIALVLFPVPDKAALQPRALDGRADPEHARPVPKNIAAARFADELRTHGVALFDPTPAQLVPGEPPRFLAQDTHWTPEWMESVARDLAAFVTRVRPLPPATSAHPYHAVSMPAERVGDLVDMLKLPDEQSLFSPQAITLHQLQDETGALWEPDPEADVLLLGDSFTNVFSLDAMGWGEAAGLAPQLARALGRSVDVIAQNDSGAFATRQMLSQALAAGEDPLRGKRVVIWEFASRELSVGDWRHFAWPGELGDQNRQVKGP
jgi:hypothetical protein